MDDRHHHEGKQHVGWKGGEELRDRLQSFGKAGIEADPHADWHPYQAGDGDQHNHANQREHAEPYRRQRIGPAERAADIIDHQPGRASDQHGQHDLPGGIAQSLQLRRRLRPHAGTRARFQREQQPADAEQRRERDRQQARAAEQIIGPGTRPRGTGGIFEPESIGPGDDRAEEQLIVEQDQHRHRAHRPGHRARILMRDRQRQPRSDPRQRDRRIANGDRFRCDDEEPPAGHRHHCIPHQAGDRVGQFQPQKAPHRREAEAASHLLQIGRHRAQRLIEAERHVPRLAGEDREHCGAFHAELLTGKKPHEKGDGEGEESEDRHRLQDIERGHDDLFRALAARGERCEHQREDGRCRQRGEHPERGAKRIARQVDRIERDRRRLQP